MKNSNRIRDLDDIIELSSNRLAITNDDKEKETIRKKLSYCYGLIEEKKKERKEAGLKENQEFF